MDYEDILRKALAILFPDTKLREQAEGTLAEYGTEDFHREAPRVKCAILKVAGADIEKLRRCTELACCDYRDMLCMAEYPEQSKRWGLKDEDPTAYENLVQEDLAQHKQWITGILAD